MALVTLCRPSNPAPDQLKVCINGAQYAIADQAEDGKWVLWSLSIYEEGRFNTIYDLLRHVEGIAQRDEAERTATSPVYPRCGVSQTCPLPGERVCKVCRTSVCIGHLNALGSCDNCSED